MAIQQSELDSLVRELERAAAMLKKIRTTQVRNGEHIDFFRATALSWFNGRRNALSNALSAATVDAIDEPYRAMLRATDKKSAKSTYANAIKAARKVLAEARIEALTPSSQAITTDSTPDFSTLASDPSMQAVLERRWQECARCIDARAPLAATVMMGGLLEALLVSRANKLADKSKMFSCAAVPIDMKTKRPLDLRQWTLGSYIDVGHELKWISNSAKSVAVVLRDYRNYIHPEKERSHGITLSQDDAIMLWEVTKSLSRQLLDMKGET